MKERACKFKAIKVICKNIHVVDKGLLVENLEKMGVSLSDINLDSIDIFVDGDIVGKILNQKESRSVV